MLYGLPDRDPPCRDQYDKMLEPVVETWRRAEAGKRREIEEHFAGMIGLSEKARKDMFVDYGTSNDWDGLRTLKFAIASALHEIDKKERPEAHQPRPQRHNWKCWHEYNCSCGLCHSVDTSD